MLVLETIAKIRRAFFVQGKSIKLICRELRVSRKVVRKVIRSQATEFRYEREAQPLPKIGPWTDQLDGLLLANEGKAARERLTLIRLFEELRGRGYGGGYDAVRRYAGRWSRERGASTASAYVPLSFAPGEAYQFDWSHEVVLLSGVTVIVKAAHVRLSSCRGWAGNRRRCDCRSSSPSARSFWPRRRSKAAARMARGEAPYGLPRSSTGRGCR